MNPKVVILGGGIAGLSAAHELIERNFDVEVYELLPIPGGKARSFSVPNSGNVVDNIVDTTRCQLNRYGRFPIDLIARSPRTITDVRALLDDVSRFLNGDLDLTHDDLRFFGSKVWQIVTSCRERRNDQY